MIAKRSIQLNCDFHIVGFGAGGGQRPKVKRRGSQRALYPLNCCTATPYIITVLLFVYIFVEAAPFCHIGTMLVD
jgi:hypothetical protein